MHRERFSILQKDWFYVALMGAVVAIFCSRLLFTDQIIRASDVITQFFWGARGIKEQSLLQYIQSLPGIFQAGWDTTADGGRTLEGGWNAIGLLFHRYLIQHFFPFPASIAWLAVLSLFWGGIGAYFYCRFIGIGRFGALAAGLLFALCTENVSLINAGHIQKIETISWLPWVLLFLEKALRSGRFFYYAMTALMLSLQFFNMHWQISFYTCLAVGAYWMFHAGEKFWNDRKGYLPQFRKEFFLAFVMVVLFFTTIAMSFAPLFSWSRQSERAGGMSQEEGMSWSMPPEEILSYVVPGLVGFSRQEGGDVPAAGEVYYWGRMHFTQTSDYLGLLPWLLLPLPLLFRRDRHTRFFTFLMAATLVMAMGKYTFVYQFMFDHLPGFSTFRVPKMILFLFAFAAAVLMGRGIDCLSEQEPGADKLKRWLVGISVFVGLIGIFWLFIAVARESILALTAGVIDAPTRYQMDTSLVSERYTFMLKEAGIAFAMACAYLSVIWAWRKKWLPVRVFLPLLLLLLLGDLWRVNDKFMVLTAPPQADKKVAKTDVVDFLQKNIGIYRMQPLNEQNAHYYSDYGLPNISAYVTISEKRYREFLENFSLMNRMPDMLNLKYLVMPADDFAAQKGELASKYAPVFTSTNGSVILENRTVLPKAWLVPSVYLATDPQQRLAIMSSSPQFNPAQVGLVESPPPLQLPPYGQVTDVGAASVTSYAANKITVLATVRQNALLVIGEKYYSWWYAYVDGKKSEIYPVNHILRGVYLEPGNHTVRFIFDPLPFKIGKYLTLTSFLFFALLLGREAWLRRRSNKK
jgi:hypothetical protein